MRELLQQSQEHSASSHIKWRANESIDAERMASDECANDVDDCIYRPDLVKVDRLDWHIVNPGFSFAQKFERANRHYSGGSSDLCSTDDVSERCLAS